jgi:hypothetical protein
LRIVTLDDNDLGQIIEGLASRAESWEATAAFLSPNEIQPESEFVEDCSSENEARQIGEAYRALISKLEAAGTA